MLSGNYWLWAEATGNRPVFQQSGKNLLEAFSYERNSCAKLFAYVFAGWMTEPLIAMRTQPSQDQH